MGILGLGVDIVYLPRITSLVCRRSSTRLAARILSPSEWHEWNAVSSTDLRQQVRFLAVRWAAKEAAYKALYPHFKPTWKELVITKGSDAKPVLDYQAMEMGDCALRFHLSLSHDGDYTVATVLVEDPA